MGKFSQTYQDNVQDYILDFATNCLTFLFGIDEQNESDLKNAEIGFENTVFVERNLFLIEIETTCHLVCL